MSERIPMLMIATGKMGVGKTYLSADFIKAYHKQFPNRRILVFDPNGEKDYKKYVTVDFDIEEIQAAKKLEKKEGRRIVTQSEKNIRSIKPGRLRKIIAFTKRGEPMSTVQMQLTMLTILRNFRTGLAVLDDVNVYIFNWQSTEIQACFKNIRHRSQDILIHMQSISPISPVLREAVSIMRLHYDGFDISNIKDRLEGMYEVVKIGQIIVDREYLQNHNRRFHLFVHVKDHLIKGVTEDQLRFGCREYAMLHKESYRQAALLEAEKNGRVSPQVPDWKKARHDWIELKVKQLSGQF